MSSFTDLTISVANKSTNRVMAHSIGAMLDTLYGKLANGGRDTRCRFYYKYEGGGSVLQVMAKSVVKGTVSELRDEAVNQFNSLFDRKKAGKEKITEEEADAKIEKQKEESKLYGKMQIGDGTLYALDDWGGKSPDALMLAIDVDNEITYTQHFPSFANSEKMGIDISNKTNNGIVNTVKANTLVWYDTTALITINSDKNLITTRVQGRDYSRKELVSNGDIKFSVSGQITSGRPDIYPTEEMQKFYKVMQYKGIVRINNQVLDQLGITHIVIENFSVTPKEGFKALQNYTFSAIGLQPEKEIKITTDTVSIIQQNNYNGAEKEENEWLKMLNNQLDGLKSMAKDAFGYSSALAAGMLDDLM